MDPNTCLMDIMRGSACESAERVEALIDWLRNGGFAPKCYVPVDCRPLFGRIGKTVCITATLRGVERADGSALLFSWSELRKPEIKAYRVYLDSQGYASKRGQLAGLAGRYFGTGEKVWAIDNEETGDRMFLRAETLKSARAQYLRSY